MEPTQYLVTSFYLFQDLPGESLESFQQSLQTEGERRHIRGLILIGTEGINATVAGHPIELEDYKTFIKTLLSMPDLTFKDSYSAKPPFRRFKVKVRKEIVTLGTPDLVPEGSKKDGHISPAEWNKFMESADTIVLDTRNNYEIDLGKFKGAHDLSLEEFQQFPERLKNSQLPKDKRYLIYCTGGIRCEKAILEMRRQGYEEVYQLDGGIINYLKEYPNAGFEGECFVFDHRVAVDQNLEPSKKYRLCPHCGQPAFVEVTCRQCDRKEIICSSCYDEGDDLLTCSKNCAHHFSKGHQSRKPHWDELRKRGY